MEVSMRGQALLLAGVLLATSLGAAAPAMADPYRAPAAYGAQSYDPYCAQKKQNRMLVGGAIGAVAGAVLGNNTAARNAQSEGSILGGVIGAASGAAIGRATAKCEAGQRQASGYGYGQDQYGLSGGPTRTSGDYGYGAPSAPRQDCRWGVTTTRDPDGRELKESVYMCRGSDGTWRRQ
jgi:hypothetical protein